MGAGAPRAGCDRDEAVPAPTSGRFQAFWLRAARTIPARNQKNSKFFEMSGLKIFRKDEANQINTT